MTSPRASLPFDAEASPAFAEQPNLLSGISAVIFDMDGVLLDTERLYSEATRQVLLPFGKSLDWQTKSRMMGRAPLLSAQLLIDTLELPMTPQGFLDAKRPLLEALFTSSEAMPGAQELVLRLFARGLPLAVATSSERDFFARKTSHHAWFERFSAIVCGSDPEVVRLKPAPDIFLEAARRLGVAPESCLVFEDSLAGVEAALAAGSRVVAIVDGHFDTAPYANAHRVIRSYAELDF